MTTSPPDPEDRPGGEALSMLNALLDTVARRLAAVAVGLVLLAAELAARSASAVETVASTWELPRPAPLPTTPRGVAFVLRLIGSLETVLDRILRPVRLITRATVRALTSLEDTLLGWLESPP